jgi:hypothetical protein
MTRSILFAAVAAVAISAAAPAQAIMANPGLNAAVPETAQLSARWHHRYYSHNYRGWRHSYAYSPYYHHRHCWSVRTWHGWVRRCSW